MGEEWEQTLRAMGEASLKSNPSKRYDRSLIYKEFPTENAPQTTIDFSTRKTEIPLMDVKIH